MSSAPVLYSIIETVTDFLTNNIEMKTYYDEKAKINNLATDHLRSRIKTNIVLA